MKIKHYDLFRIKNKRELKDLNIFEKDNNLITFVEWPEIIKDIQEKVIVLRFNYENELNNRSVEINRHQLNIRMKNSKDLQKIKGDASFRTFYRSKKNNSIVVYAKKEKKKIY